MYAIDPDSARWPTRAWLLALALLLSGCGGGGGSAPPATPVADPCGPVESFDGAACRAFAMRSFERAATPFTENGQPVELEVVLYRPLAGSRHPTLIFNHGSTGDGSDPSLFTQTFTSKALAQFFAERGWMVAFVQRRGRGASDGLYDEGFTADRGAYSCDAGRSLAGAQRALQDIDAATDWLLQRADVDTTRVLVGGFSRGGVLSVAFAAQRPDVFRAAINFVGGWIGEGCGDYRQVNESLFTSGATYPGPTLWLYAQNDSFYSIGHSRQNFAAFEAAGGIGTFEEYQRAPGLNGHFLINDAELWGAAVAALLQTL